MALVPAPPRSTLHSDAAWGAASVLLSALLACSSLIANSGLPNTSDGVLHLWRALELSDAWRSGVIYPRWAPHFAFGLGYPIFNYVPPVTGFLTAAIGATGVSLQEALKLVVLLAVLAGGAGAYALGKGFLPSSAAVVAGMAYALAPYRLFELYVQGNYPQLLATAVMPWSLWAVQRLGKRVDRRGYLVLGGSLALLTLSHNISAVLFAPLIGAYGLWRLLRAGERRAWFLALGACLTGVAASSFFWLPAILERDLAQTWRLTRDFFDFRHYFLSLPEVLALPETLDLRAANPYYPMSLGGHLVLLAAPSLALLGRGHAARSHVAFMWAALCAYVLLMLPVSEPIWSGVPYLAYAEFPHRLLCAAALPLALLVGAGSQALRLPAPAMKVWLVASIVALLLGAAPYLFPRRPFVDWSGAGVGNVAAYEASSGNLGTTSAGEYLPRWVTEKPTAEMRSVALAGVTILEERPDRAHYLIRRDEPGSFELPVLYFPGWQASVDGAPSPLAPSEGSGMALLSVPAGEHDVTLHLANTWPRSLAWRLSLVGALLLIAGLGPASARASRAEPVAERGVGRLLPALACSLCVLVVVKWAYIEPRTMLFRRYSPPGQVLGTRHPLDVGFGGEIALLGYDIQRNLPPQGESLVLRLYWQPLRQLSRDYRVRIALDGLSDGRTLVSAERAAPGGTPSSNWHPALYVEDRYEIGLPADLPAVRYALRVSVLDPETGRALPTDDEGGTYTLQEVQVLYHLPQDVKRFAGGRWYRFGDDVQLLGYDLGRTTLTAGASTELTLYWRADAPTSSALKRFVHLLGPDGQIVAQWDQWPVQGLYPTDRWLPRHIVADTIAVSVPSSAGPGRYSLLVGLYDAATLQRPPVYENGKLEVTERAVLLPTSLEIR